MTSVLKILKDVREGVNLVKPGVSLTTEGPVIDLWYQYLDGNEGYAVRQYQLPSYGPPINFMRFIYPEFKYVNIRTGTVEEERLQMKQIVFNGDAGHMNPDNVETFDADAERLYHESVDAFSGLSPVPHLPTRQPGLYCNKFPSETKTVYTFWNDNDYRLSGAFLPIDLNEGEHLVELVRNKGLKTTNIDGQPHAVLNIPQKDLAVMAVLPKRIDYTLDGIYLRPEYSQREGTLYALMLDDNDQEVDRIELSKEEELNLADHPEHRVVLKLLDNHEKTLLDQIGVPRIEEIDLATFAKVSASPTSLEHNNNPESVAKAKEFGSWQVKWDDEPRPGWFQLEWDRPQTFNNVRMRFSRPEYSTRDYEIQVSDDGENWETVHRGDEPSLDTNDVFDNVTAKFLRVTFHMGGPWGNLVHLTKMEVVLAQIGA